MVKNSPASAGGIRDSDSVSELGRSPGEGHGSSLQYSCLENPMTEDSGRLQSWGHKESDVTEATEHTQGSRVGLGWGEGSLGSGRT